MDTDLKFMAPATLASLYESEASHIPNQDLFNDPKYQKLTEKWVAAKVGAGYELFVRPCQIAINESREREYADFFLRTAGEIYPFQITEVLEEGRHRGDEFKGFADGTIQCVPYEPGRGQTGGPIWIAEGIAKKAEKHYSNSQELSLVIYANFPATQLMYEDIKSAASTYRDTFHSIWVVTNYLISSLFSTDQLGSVDGWGVMGEPDAT